MKKEGKPNKRRRGVILFFISLVVLSHLISLIFNGRNLFNSFHRYITSVSYGFFLGLFLGGGTPIIGVICGRSLNWRVNPRKANNITLVLMVSYGIIMSLLIPYIYYKYIWHVPKDTLTRNLLPSAFFSLMIDFFFTAIYYSKYLAIYWGRSIKNEERLEKESLVAKYEALKNQVNPHFLFNSLNTLTGLVEKDQKLAIQYIKKLSDLLRKVLEAKDKELISVKEELECVSDYIFLHKLRHGDGLQYIASPGIDGYVAPLAIQMLVENAIKHNVISDDQPLKIEVLQEDNYFVIKNNLQKKKVLEGGNTIGLENLVARYKYISDKDVEILETESDFIVKLPVIKNIEG